MWLDTACHWLQVNGFWPAVLTWAVFSVLTAAVAWRPWSKHHKQQAKIADSLDTSTPGGLSDLVTAVNKLREQGENREADR